MLTCIIYFNKQIIPKSLNSNDEPLLVFEVSSSLVL